MIAGGIHVLHADDGEKFQWGGAFGAGCIGGDVLTLATLRQTPEG